MPFRIIIFDRKPQRAGGKLAGGLAQLKGCDDFVPFGAHQADPGVEQFLFAQRHGDFRNYHHAIYENFWRRELDIEDPLAITAALETSGIESEDFTRFIEAEGRQLLDENQRDAESHGVFGVPSYLVNEELFWGAERFERAIEAAMARRTIPDATI